jgi:hypothetical protein
MRRSPPVHREKIQSPMLSHRRKTSCLRNPHCPPRGQIQVEFWRGGHASQGLVLDEENCVFDEFDMAQLGVDRPCISTVQRLLTTVFEEQRCGVWPDERLYYVEELHTCQLLWYLGTGACGVDVSDAVGPEVYDGCGSISYMCFLLCLHAGKWNIPPQERWDWHGQDLREGLTDTLQVRTETQNVAFTCVVNFCLNIYYGTLYAYTPEVLPSAHRGTGNGMAVAGNRIMGIMSAVIATEAGVSFIFSLSFPCSSTSLSTFSVGY